MQFARQLRRRIIPLYVHHDSPTDYTLWRRDLGQLLSENPVLVRGRIPQPSQERDPRSQRRYLQRRASRGTLLRDRKGTLSFAPV